MSPLDRLRSRARPVALVTAWLAVCVQLTGLLHFALVQHATCAAHGELVHVDADHAGFGHEGFEHAGFEHAGFEHVGDHRAGLDHAGHHHDQPDAPLPVADLLHGGDADHSHDHCEIGCLPRDVSLVPVAELAAAELPPPPRGPPLPRAPRDEPVAAVAPLDLAPKSSPPA